jgi:hypothetical protein
MRPTHKIESEEKSRQNDDNKKLEDIVTKVEHGEDHIIEPDEVLDLISSKNLITFECDSGASEHFVNNAHLLTNYDSTDRIVVELADQSSVSTQGKGSIGSKLSHVHVISSFGSNLLSMILLYKEGKATLFHPEHGVVIANAQDMKVKCNAALCIGRLEDDRFIVNLHTAKTGKTNCPPESFASISSYAAAVTIQETKPVSGSSKTSNSSKAMLQFKRLGLTSPSRILEVHKRRLAYKIDLPSDLTIADFSAVQSVDVFHQARSRAKAHHNLHSFKKTGKPFDKLWFDIKSVSHPSYSNCTYFIVIVC